MPRESPYPILLSTNEAEELRRRSAKYTLPYFRVVRAKMILLAADGPLERRHRAVSAHAARGGESMAQALL